MPGEKGAAGAAEGKDADIGDHERESMGTMTGWQALADEVKSCQSYAAYNTEYPCYTQQEQAYLGIAQCMSAFHVQTSCLMLNGCTQCSES